MLEVTCEADVQQLSGWRIEAEGVGAKDRLQNQQRLTIQLVAPLVELPASDALIDAVCGVDGHEVRAWQCKLRTVLRQSHQDLPVVCIGHLLLCNIDVIVAPKCVPSINA